jgi:O-antigen/teichoic acid export membrane protein
LRRLLPLLMATFLIRGSMAVHEAYLRKRILFRRLQLINIASVVAYGTVAVALAWWGAGGWSLAWGLLAGSCTYAGLVLAGSGMPLSLNPHLRYWRDLFAYGRWVFLGGVATWLLQTGDNLAVGKFLGPANLGVYALAYSYGLLPFMLIGGAVAQAMFPAYSRLQEDYDQFQALVMKIVRMSAVVSLPIAGAFLFAAGDVLVALLGPRWTQVGPPFRVFAVVFTAGMFTASFPRVYDALNRPIINLYLALAALPVMVAGTAIGLRMGVLGVALGISAMMIELCGLQVFAVSRTTGLSIRRIMGGVWPPALCASLGVAAGMLPFVLLRADLPSLGVDAAASLVMFGVYVLGLRRFFPSWWSEALSQGRAVFAGSRSAG